MTYLLALCDGARESHAVRKLMDEDDEEAQIILFNGVMSDDGLEEFKDDLDTLLVSTDSIYAFVDNISPIQHRNIYDAVSEIINVVIIKET